MTMLSEKNKQILVNHIQQKLTVDTLSSRDNISNPIYIFKYKNYHPLFIQYMMEWINENYTYTEEEFTDAITSEQPYDTKLFKILDDRQQLLKAHVHCINKLFDEIPINKFKFTYNQTDYRPCHNILVSIGYKNTRCSWMNTTNIQIRKDDFPFNEGECYGRNTHMVEVYELTNINFEKYCNKIGIKID